MSEQRRLRAIARLKEIREQLRTMGDVVREIQIEAQRLETEIEPPVDLIEPGDLSVRAYRCIRHRATEVLGREISSWRGLANCTRRELRRIQHFGSASLREVERALALRGLRLRG